MENENRGRLIRATGLYLFVAAVLGGISYATPYTVGDFGSFLPYMPDSLRFVGISVVLLPMLAGITLWYLGALLSIVFEGKLNRVLVSGLYAGGFAAIFGIFMILQPISEPTKSAGYLVLAAFALFYTYNILSAVSEIRSQFYLRVISGSATIFIIGQIAIQLVNLYMTTPGVPETQQVMLIRDMLNWGFAAAAAITLIGIFRDSRNPYLAEIGGIASSYFFVIAMSLIGTLYVNFITGRLLAVSPVIEQLKGYVEWTGIVIVGALIFTVMRRGMKESMMAPAEVGPWAKHIQDISATKGKALTDFTEILDEFVKDGSKERLLVKLFIFLEENRAAEVEITLTLRELINYEDEMPPNFSRRGTSARLERQNQERRLELLRRTIERIDQLGLGGLLREPARMEGQVSMIESMED
ncbi:hypothetical protein JXL21_12625 [Candidatus Bathyarchaeota archaeon]|nr:hypothetical protein [Candidatus Bathyarchaeota archaeon]